MSGHDFSRADKASIFITPSGLQPPEESALPSFLAACSAAPLQVLNSCHHEEAFRPTRACPEPVEGDLLFDFFAARKIPPPFAPCLCGE